MEPPDAVLAAASATSETSFLDAALPDCTMLLPCRRAPVRLELWMLMLVPRILTSQALSSLSVHSATQAMPLPPAPLLVLVLELGLTPTSSVGRRAVLRSGAAAAAAGVSLCARGRTPAP